MRLFTSFHISRLGQIYQLNMWLLTASLNRHPDQLLVQSGMIEPRTQNGLVHPETTIIANTYENMYN